LRPLADFEASRPACCFHFQLLEREARMKAFAAMLIAAGFLYFVDLGINDGRYAEVIRRAITSVL
jgi:hypothetical protein